jgi:hypothetical protein
MFHLTLHLAVPGLVAWLVFRERFKLTYLLLILTMLVDLDHLLANPIYEASRCSIGFHPLHQPWFIALYAILSFLPKTRIIGIGLIIHMALDAIDCQYTNGLWFVAQV